MNVCPYCSHDNQHEGPCARCGLEGNPSGTPWGIRKDRNTKYWNKYNWNSQTFTDGHGTKEPITAQERGNKINHDKIMGVIKPHKRGNLEKDPHFTASQPAMYDLDVGDVSRGVIAVPPGKPKPVKSITMPEGPLGEEPELLTSDLSSIILADVDPVTFNGRTVLSTNTAGEPSYIFNLPPVDMGENQRFDLLDNIWLTARQIDNRFKPITNQNPWGTCYSHASAGIGGWYKDASNPNFIHWLYKKAHGVNTIGGDWYPPGLLEGNHGGTIDALLLTDVNEGQLSTSIEEFNESETGICDDITLIGFRGQARQVSVGSTPKRSNVWSRGNYSSPISDGEVGSPKEIWSIVSSSIYHGIPMYLSTGWPESLSTPTNSYEIAKGNRLGNHAIDIVGVEIRKKIPKALDNPGTRLTFEPQKTHTRKKSVYGKGLETPKRTHNKLKQLFGVSLTEIKQMVKLDTRTSKAVVRLSEMWNPEEEEEIIRILKEAGYENIEIRIPKMLGVMSGSDDPDDPLNTELPPTEDPQFGVMKGDKPPNKMALKTLTPNAKNPDPSYYTGTNVLEKGVEYWVKIRNSHGEGWGDKGYLWVEYTSFFKYWNYIGGLIEVTAIDSKPVHEAPVHEEPKKNKNNNRGKGKRKGKYKGKKRNAKNNPSTQMQKTSTPVQMRPRNTTEYQPTGHAYTKPELLVALDIDDTLVDTSQRMRSAKRMGLFDPKQVGNKQHPKGRQAFLEFFYSSDRFSLDKPIQGAVDYAYSLVQQGYKIAYITGRPEHTYEITKAQLRNLGFPLTNDKYGATLLYCKPEAAKETASWKKNILSSLQNNYDVRFFFDNNPKNLEAARQLNIPGLYLAIDQYTGITALANRFKKVPAHIDNPHHEDEEEEAYRDMFDDSPWANPPTGLLPIFNGEPKTLKKNLGIVSAEVEVGRNIFADVGEGIQDVYRGLIGGRQSMTEKRMVMAVAALEKELSDRAREKGGEAVANLQVDFGSWKKSAIAVVAFGDAITLISGVKNNPGHSDGAKLYKDFNGKAPDVVQSTQIEIPTTLVRVGEGGCWSVGYRSDKEGHGKTQKYIHEFGDFGRFPKKKPTKGNKKEPDLYAALDEKGNIIDLRIIGGTFSLDNDPDSGINWLVG